MGQQWMQYDKFNFDKDIYKMKQSGQQYGYVDLLSRLLYVFQSVG